MLCYVTDRRGAALPGGVTACAARAAAAGVDWIQLREKDLPARQLAALAAEALAAARGTPARIVINDRLDIAVSASAGGVHLGGESLPVAAVKRWCAARRDLPAGFLVGRSCHWLEEARAAEAGGADYLFFGPVFETPAKAKFGPPQGIEKLAAVCAAVRIPVLAIGGITVENAGECFRAGAAGIAAIRLFQQPGDVFETVRRLRA